MRWFFLALVGATVLTLQASVAPRFELAGVRPDWILVVVVFFGLHAPRLSAIIGAWTMGMCADFLTIERLGLLSISYLVVAVGVTSIREYLFARRLTTQTAVTLLAAALLQTVWLVYRRFHLLAPDSLGSEIGRSIFFGALYTAVWAPLFHPALKLCAHLIGFAPSRSFDPVPRSMGAGHV